MSRPPLALLVALALACRQSDKEDTGGVVQDTDAITADADGDGWGADEDCDDDDPDVHPGATEVCDGVDNDCDTQVDEGTTSTWYTDADGDGYGDDGTAVEACGQPAGTVAAGGDCDDADDAVHPGAPERCDGQDQDCDGTIDEDVQEVWYADLDDDGFGDADNAVANCDPPDGYVSVAGDCDDGEAAVNPDATEICNAVDDDCDGEVDEEASDAGAWYGDGDGDGFGSPDDVTTACEQPSGTVAEGTDCDDGDAAVNPDADELCNEVDDDCDGVVDDDAVDAATWYADTDADGYGDSDLAATSCDEVPGFVADATDCDDADPTVSPAAAEVCDGIDNDCDGAVDDDDSSLDTSSGETFYADADGDGYGDPGSVVMACTESSGAVDDASDCDDTDAAVNPDGLEICDGLDNDCDGSTDGADAWWDTGFSYRVPLVLTASGYDVEGPPVVVDLDFRAELDALGDSSAFDEDTLRVVLQDCDAGQPELPSQFLDEWVGVFDKVDSADPAGDEAGAVAFLYDEDGDYATLETLPAGGSVRVAVYFGGSAGAPGYSSDLAASTAELSNSQVTALFDSAAGGLLDSLELDGSPSLTSQTDSCCGNGLYTLRSWNIDAQDGAGTVTLLEDGPVFAAIASTGSRADSMAAYDYSYTYWIFAGRPELYSKVTMETTAASTNTHPGDITSGIRPWETRQDAISGDATTSFTTDGDSRYADVSNGTWGMSWGYVQEPLYVVGLSNYDPYLIVMGNDAVAYGTGTPGTLAAGTVFFDHVVQVVLPHAGDFADVEDTFFGLVDGVDVAASPAESW